MLPVGPKRPISDGPKCLIPVGTKRRTQVRPKRPILSGALTSHPSRIKLFHPSDSSVLVKLLHHIIWAVENIRFEALYIFASLPRTSLFSLMSYVWFCYHIHPCLDLGYSPRTGALVHGRIVRYLACSNRKPHNVERVPTRASSQLLVFQENRLPKS